MSESRRELTEGERKAISALKRVAAKWPDTIMLFSAAGSLVVLDSDKSGWESGAGGVLRQDAPLANIDIPNDGGDPW